MLVFISDLHLRPGNPSPVSRAAQFRRLWELIEGGRPEAPVRLCLVGDIFDLVRATAENLPSDERYQGICW